MRKMAWHHSKQTMIMCHTVLPPAQSSYHTEKEWVLAKPGVTWYTFWKPLKNRSWPTVRLKKFIIQETRPGQERHSLITLQIGLDYLWSWYFEWQLTIMSEDDGPWRNQLLDQRWFKTWLDKAKYSTHLMPSGPGWLPSYEPPCSRWATV